MKRVIRDILLGVMMRLASGVYRKYRPIVIAITGAVGKTSAKEAIYQMLAAQFPVARSLKNENSEWGAIASVIAPNQAVYIYGEDGKARVTFGRSLYLFGRAIGMLLWSVRYPKVLVLELAFDRPGEMAWFNRWLAYDVVVVTSFGQAHREFFTSNQELLGEHLVPLAGLRPNGLAIVSGDYPVLRQALTGYRGRLQWFGFGSDNDINGSLAQVWDGDVVKYRIAVKQVGNFEVAWPPGRQLLLAALPAVGIGLDMGMVLDQIRASLSEMPSVAGRFETWKLKGNRVVINDAYNASPDSVKLAIDSLQDMRLGGGRLIVVVGDMRELGEAHIVGHEEVGRYMVDKIDRLFVVGEGGKLIATAAAAAGMPLTQIFSIHDDENNDKLAALILADLRDNDVVLVKASRALRLDEVAQKIAQKVGSIN